MNTNNLKRIFEDQDFAELVAGTESRLIAKVMSSQTTPDDRALALAEFHGLQRVMKAMLSAASQPTKE
jgi:hypothetical protein